MNTLEQERDRYRENEVDMRVLGKARQRNKPTAIEPHQTNA
jgi:hypothetical protein